MKIPFVSRHMENVANQREAQERHIQRTREASRAMHIAAAMTTGYCGTVTVSSAEADEYRRIHGEGNEAEVATAALQNYYSVSGDGR